MAKFVEILFSFKVGSESFLFGCHSLASDCNCNEVGGNEYVQYL